VGIRAAQDVEIVQRDGIILLGTHQPVIKRAFDNFFAQVFSLALCGIHIVSHILCESCRNKTVGANSVRPSDHMLSMGYAF
uniref:hypothetical protein n=1 Tax=Ruminococcus sp. TaxID=41978 RepID=UPI003AB31152